jgi:hypothetical protein
MEKKEIEIDLPENEIFELMKIAHEEDITFNQLIEKILREKLKMEEKSEGEALNENT